MTLTDFLLARIAEDEARPDCDGSGEYASCARWSEQRERECAAKRRIVEATRFDDAPESVVDFYLEEQRTWAKPWPLRLPQHVEVMVDTLRALASVYADHPDYDQAWRA